MSRSYFLLTTAALFLMALAGSGAAQQPPAPDSMPPTEPDTAQDSGDRSAWQEWRDNMHRWMMGDDDGDGPGGWMGWRGDGGPGVMWGGGMPMHSGMMPMMMMMMMVMMDTDGNGSISFEEVEAVHRRVFNLVDQDKNGQLSAEEIQAVIGGASAAR